jgi:hypothetical protein
MKLGNLYTLLSGFIDNFRHHPVLIWNLDENRQEDSLYRVEGVHYLHELGAIVIKVKRKKQ